MKLPKQARELGQRETNLNKSHVNERTENRAAESILALGLCQENPDREGPVQFEFDFSFSLAPGFSPVTTGNMTRETV